MRTRWKVLLGVGIALVAAVVVIGVLGLFLLLSGEGTGHIEWARLAEAPAGAQEMGTDGFDETFLADLRAAAPGEGGLLLTGSANDFWEDVRAAGAVETQGGCLAVTVDAIPVEFCEGPLI